MRKIFLFVALLFTAGLFAQVQNVSITEVPETLWEEGVLVDVRTPEEFAQGYVPGATLINYYADDFKAQITKIDKGSKVLLYCKSGRRSANAAAMLDSLGYKEVYNLVGGYDRWEAAHKKEGQEENKDSMQGGKQKEKLPQKEEGFWESLWGLFFD